MATETLNHFTLLAEQHLALLDHSEFNKTAGCAAPKVDARTLNLLESNADVTIADIAAGMQGLAHLITCRIPSDHIPIRSWPLFLARELMRDLIETLKAEQST